MGDKEKEGDATETNGYIMVAFTRAKVKVAILQYRNIPLQVISTLKKFSLVKV